MPILSLALKSIANRKATFFLTFFSIAISVMLLLGVQMLKKEAKFSFMQSISGTDLIVGPRSSKIELLLYSVFHIGTPSSLISYHSFEELSKNKNIKWAIPISLGDSHKGFNVLATNESFFKHFSYANSNKLTFSEGEANQDMFDIVLGYEVAKKLNYKIGDKIVLSHGASKVSFMEHDELPFKIKGILNPTQTPIDKTLVISLYATEALHDDSSKHFLFKKPSSENSHHHEEHHHHHEEKENSAQKLAKTLKVLPEKISAVYLGVEYKNSILGLQRSINNYKEEALSAIIPALAVQDLWDFFQVVQTALDITTILVVVMGLLGMLSIILMSLNERKREMAILRSVGAKPFDIVKLIVGESAIVCAISILFGILLLYLAIFSLADPLYNIYGFYLEIKPLGISDLSILAIIELCAILISFIPAFLIYKHSLSDGMSIKV